MDDTRKNYDAQEKYIDPVVIENQALKDGLNTVLAELTHRLDEAIELKHVYDFLDELLGLLTKHFYEYDDVQVLTEVRELIKKYFSGI